MYNYIFIIISTFSEVILTVGVAPKYYVIAIPKL